MLYFWRGCRGKLKLITLRSEKFKYGALLASGSFTFFGSVSSCLVLLLVPTRGGANVNIEETGSKCVATDEENEAREVGMRPPHHNDTSSRTAATAGCALHEVPHSHLVTSPTVSVKLTQEINPQLLPWIDHFRCEFNKSRVLYFALVP